VADDLAALLNSCAWVRRRVDRIEFVDLLTVRRSITLTLDLGELARIRERCSLRRDRPHLVPLGWFVPWANAGAVLLDADQRVIPYLTAAESDELVRVLLAKRLRQLGIAPEPLDRVPKHRSDPGQPGDGCKSCEQAGKDPGYRELMSNKWGCPAVLELLNFLPTSPANRLKAAQELTRILLAWQTNFVLFARLDVSSVPGDRVTLQLSYDEELVGWEPRWERRRRVLRQRRAGLSRADAKECRKHISRGGQFAGDLDLLLPRGLAGPLARSRFGWLRKPGRRGMYGVVWHVAWHQASGLAVADQQVDIVLPSELAVVRMRMLQVRSRRRCATVADQVGSRATIVAPKSPHELPAGDVCEKSGRQWSPTLFSLAITQRSPTPWYGGAAVALLTGLALIVLALGWMREVAGHLDAAVTVLMLAPTLVSTVLAVRAASDIAAALTTRLRLLIGSVGVLAVACAVGLLVQPARPAPPLLNELLEWLPGVGRSSTPSLTFLRDLWVGAGCLLLGVAAVLFVGGWRIKRLLAYGRRPSPRYLEVVTTGSVLNPHCYPRIPPPDRWLNADEGDLIPWGWTNGPHSYDLASDCDRYFWNCSACNHIALIKRVRCAIGYDEPKECDASTCRCRR
jgi:hypothetical protein